MLPTMYHDVLLEFVKSKKLAAVFLLYFAAITLLFVQVTHAFFTSSASSTNNTFTAAAEFPTQAPLTAPAGSVVINEIMWMGSSASTSDEWIELRNMTGNTYDMTGWQFIVVGSSDITIPSGTLPPHGYFLVSNFGHNSASSILNVAPDFVTTSLSLSNTSQKIYLANQAHDVVDLIGDGTAPFKGVNGSVSVPNKSMERNDPPGNGVDPGQWHSASSAINLDATIDLATPKAPNSL